jgi:hypothetical protein
MKEEFTCNERIVQIKPLKRPIHVGHSNNRPGYQSSSSEENDAIVNIERSPGDNTSNE